MNRVNLVNKLLDTYLRYNQHQLMSEIQTQLNSAADGYLFSTLTVTDNYSMSINDSTVFADASNGVITVTLKSAPECKQKLVVIKKVDATANVVEVTSSETIDGVSMQLLSSQYDVIRLMSDGAQWLKV